VVAYVQNRRSGEPQILLDLGGVATEICTRTGDRSHRLEQPGILVGDRKQRQVAAEMWTFTIPKMLRPYFLRHRELLGSLCRAAYETVQELMASAAIGVDGLRTGMVAVVHPCGDLLTLNPHVHALAPRGGWAPDGSWVPVPFVDERCAETGVLAEPCLPGLPGRARPGPKALVARLPAPHRSVRPRLTFELSSPAGFT